DPLGTARRMAETGTSVSQASGSVCDSAFECGSILAQRHRADCWIGTRVRQFWVHDSAAKIWVQFGSNNDSDALFTALKWLSVPPDSNKLRALGALSRQRSRVRAPSSPPAFFMKLQSNRSKTPTHSAGRAPGFSSKVSPATATRAALSLLYCSTVPIN